MLIGDTFCWTALLPDFYCVCVLPDELQLMTMRVQEGGLVCQPARIYYYYYKAQPARIRGYNLASNASPGQQHPKRPTTVIAVRDAPKGVGRMQSGTSAVSAGSTPPAERLRLPIIQCFLRERWLCYVGCPIQSQSLAGLASRPAFGAS